MFKSWAASGVLGGSTKDLGSARISGCLKAVAVQLDMSMYIYMIERLLGSIQRMLFVLSI